MRDPICLHAQPAVSDGFTLSPGHPLSPAIAHSAVAAWETCAHTAAALPPRGRPGQAVRLPSQALTDPRATAAALAPLLASETVEVFAVARLTLRFAQAADILDMPLLDHLIVGDAGRYFSFRESGTLPTRLADGARA